MSTGLGTMAYQHKKALCSKTTKDILENILGLRDAEYGLDEASQAAKGTSLVREMAKGTIPPNALPGQEEAPASEDEDEMEHIQVHDHATEDFENYKPPTELEFEAQEPKVRFEKRGKHRNYVEFRFDYGRL